MGEHFAHLTYADRLKIEALLECGAKISKIAEVIHVSVQTIYRELKRGRYVKRNTDWTETEKYSPDIAHERYRKHLKEKGAGLKLGNDMEFVKYIEHKIIEEKRSPAAALADMKRDGLTFQTDICLSTLYNYIRGDVFLNLTMALLPYGRDRKKHKKRKVQKRAARGESIENRPEEICTREEFGHWEMDTVVGAQGKAKKSLLALTERKTREEIIEKMNSHTAEEVVRILDKIERQMGEKKFREVFKTITVDNGSEFSDYKGMERSRRNKKNRTKIYYCHPYAPHERGTNEVQNRLIRRHVPKGTVFDEKPKTEIKWIERWINTYPRALLGYRTSQELFDEELRRLAV